MPTPLRVLFIEDSEADAALIGAHLRHAGLEFRLERVDTAAAMRAALAAPSWDLVLADDAVPGFGALEALALLRASPLDLPFIIVSGAIQEDEAVTALKAGAHDFVLKTKLARLVPAIQRELRAAADRQQQRVAQAALAQERSLLHALIDNVPDLIYAKDRASRFTLANRASAGSLGRAPEDVVGRTDFELHPPELAAQFFADEQAVMRANQPLVDREETVFVDGQPRWLLTTTVPVRDSAGQVTGLVGISRDITDRKRAAEALAASERRFRALIENSSDGIALLDAAGTVLYTSPTAARIVGGAPADWVGGNFLTRVHPQDAPRVAALFSELLTTPEARPSAEFRYQRQDGSWFWLEATGANMLADPAVNAIVANYRDTTERRRVEDALRVSEARFSAMFRASPIAISLTTVAEGRYIDVNAAFEGLLGYARDEIIGRTTSELRIWAAPDQRAAIVAALREHGQLRDVELNLRQQSGGTLHCLASLELVRLDAEDFILGLFMDITARKRAEAALLESSAQFRTLFEASPDAIMLIDPVGAWPIVDCNTAACRMNGYTRAELIGQSVDVLNLTPADEAERAAYLEQIRQKGVIYVEAYHRRKDGSVFPIEVSTSLITLQGRQTILGIDRDITGRKRAEAEIQQRLAELDAINRVSAALRQAKTVSEMLPQLLADALAALRGSAGSIWLFDAARDEVWLAHEQGWGRSVPPFKRGQGVPGHVVATGQPYLSRELKTDPRMPESVREFVPAGRGGACVPIRYAASIIGVLYINADLPHEFSASDVRLLSTLAEIAGSTYHRLQLNEQTERRLSQLSALRAIDQAISSNLDVRLTLDIILAQVTSLLQVDAADVLLFGEIETRLRYAAGRGFRTSAITHSQLRLGEGAAGRAGLERRVVQVPDIRASQSGFLRASLLAPEDFVGYLAVPLLAKGRLQGVLEVFHRGPLAPDLEWLNFLEALAGQAAIALDNAELFSRLQHSNIDLQIAYDATIEGWSAALDLRDKETEGHSRRVTDLTERLARSMGLSEAELVPVRRGALLHDIGKMGVPDQILLKAEPLTDEEWAIMRQHPDLAYRMLAPIAYLRSALDIPYCHHEKWDGTGYPRGLAGEQIPLAARIFAVVDVWDALRSDRPYRRAWPVEKVRAHIRAGAGAHFDPAVVETFLEMDLGAEGRRPG